MAKSGRAKTLRKVIRKGVEQWNAPILTFLKNIELGMSIKASCNSAGFCEDIFYDAQKKANEDFAKGEESIETEFIEEFEKAKGNCQQICLNSINLAIQKGVWQAGAWLLERKFSKDFAIKQEIEVQDRVEIVNDIPEVEKDEI